MPSARRAEPLKQFRKKVDESSAIAIAKLIGCSRVYVYTLYAGRPPGARVARTIEAKLGIAAQSWAEATGGTITRADYAVITKLTDKIGDAAAAKKLNCTAYSLNRLLARRTVRRGTVLAVRAGLNLLRGKRVA